ncbi:Plant intracellular Ras-group-related LRR protein 4 [Phytophthora citrophthora]|uniref:Plant intracellular Ras-group-related LRR protein 4 n=1 Tax=Phytophthora citrophthora TaxID=4793 RepID=A0AAD9GRA8_9STRA|nr:Plant intracellular Ras-group-related LRR protein 4 [Phytophthora citrophthora]
MVVGNRGSIDREERKLWLGEQLEQRQKQRDRDREEQLKTFELENDKLWTPFALTAKTTGELNVAWKEARGFFTWERVFPFRNLLALRITGHNLLELPESLPVALPSLETLSLIADGLERLPESIGVLTRLIELDLTKNRLRELPDSITELTELTSLNLSCNLLEKLPQDFGKLVKLDKLWLERNALRQLPESIGQCRSVRSANLSNNKLMELPDSIGELTSLTSLTVNLNELQELPDTVVSLLQLKVVHASRNQLTKLPRTIGEMQGLRELRLDWNAIQELPFSFRALANLKILCIEQNPLRQPPSDVVARGVTETLKYMEKALAEFQRSSRREVVEALQKVLGFAAQLINDSESIPESTGLDADSTIDTDLQVILSLFESNCGRLAPSGTNNELKLYGIVWELFYSELLPAIERQQELKLLNTNQTQDDSKCKPTPPFSQQFTPEEVEDALLNYDDEFGLASVAGAGEIPNVPVEFRRCACIDPIALRERGQRIRRVCLPRTAPYRCQRPGRLLRAQMLTNEQVQDQLASIYLRTKVARLVQKTRRRAVEYINSMSGVAHFERLARVLAHEMAQRRRRLQKLYKKHEKAQKHIDSRRDKLHRKVEAFQRAKEKRLSATREKLSRLEKDREALELELENAEKGGALAASKTKKLGKLDDKLTKLRTEVEEAESDFGGPENAKIYEIELAIEGLNMEEQKLHKTTEKDRVREMDADVGEEESEAEEESEEEESESDDNEDDDSGSEEEESESESEVPETEASKVSSAAPTNVPTNSVFDINMPDMEIDDYRKAAVKAVDQELEKRALEIENDPKNTKISTSAVAKKPTFNIPLAVPEEELHEMFQAQIRECYVEMQCSKISLKATKEFLQMRVVLQRWRGLGTRAVFEAWHEVAKASRLDAEAVKARMERKKLLEKQNKELEEQLIRIEARRWVQRTDMYTDAIYYENETTGETRWEPPQYWIEEQHIKQTKDERRSGRKGDVPLLKLPPI